MGFIYCRQYAAQNNVRGEEGRKGHCFFCPRGERKMIVMRASFGQGFLGIEGAE